MICLNHHHRHHHHHHHNHNNNNNNHNNNNHNHHNHNYDNHHRHNPNHNHDNHYYIMKDNDKIYCTKEVKEYYKKTKQSQQPKSQPITHTLQTFEMNGNKYAIEKLNKNYCVRRNGMYMCTNQVNEIIKQIYGGVPVNIEPEYNQANPNSYTIKNPKFEQKVSFERWVFIMSL